MTENFNIYSKYYDLLYQNKDYFAEANYISDCIKNNSPEAKTILELGSGTGGHGLFLKKLGYDIYGIERSKMMVKIAMQNGFPCDCADIIEFKLENKFNVVIALFHVISYITDNKSIIKVFRNAANHLSSGGLFIFDIWYSPAVYSQKPETRIKKVENDLISVIRIAEPVMQVSENIVEVIYSILVKDKKLNVWTEIQENHPMRHFSIPEIRLLASQTGFEIINIEEFLTKLPPSIDTWGVNFILKKHE